MMMRRNIHNTWKKTIATGVVCLFLANQFAWAYPDSLATSAGSDEVYEQMLERMEQDLLERCEENVRSALGGLEATQAQARKLAQILAVATEEGKALVLEIRDGEGALTQSQRIDLKGDLKEAEEVEITVADSKVVSVRPLSPGISHYVMIDRPYKRKYQEHVRDRSLRGVRPLAAEWPGVIEDALTALRKIAEFDRSIADTLAERLDTQSKVYESEGTVTKDGLKIIESGINLVEEDEDVTLPHAGGFGINIPYRQGMTRREIFRRFFHEIISANMFGEKTRVHQLADAVVDAVERQDYEGAARLLSRHEITNNGVAQSVPDCIAQAAVNIARYVHDGEFDSMVMSGGSASLSRQLFIAAWKRLYGDRPMPRLYMLDQTANFELYRKRSWEDLDPHETEQIILTHLGTAEGGALLNDLKTKKVVHVDDVAETGNKVPVLTWIFEELQGAFPVSFALITAKPSLQQRFSEFRVVVGSWNELAYKSTNNLSIIYSDQAHFDETSDMAEEIRRSKKERRQMDSAIFSLLSPQLAESMAGEIEAAISNVPILGDEAVWEMEAEKRAEIAELRDLAAEEPGDAGEVENKARILELVRERRAQGKAAPVRHIARELRIPEPAVNSIIQKYPDEVGAVVNEVSVEVCIARAISRRISAEEPRIKGRIANEIGISSPAVSMHSRPDSHPVIARKFEAPETEVPQPDCYSRLDANIMRFIDSIDPDPVICNFLAALWLGLEQSGLNTEEARNGIVLRLEELDEEIPLEDAQARAAYYTDIIMRTRELEEVPQQLPADQELDRAAALIRTASESAGPERRQEALRALIEAGAILDTLTDAWTGTGLDEERIATLNEELRNAMEEIAPLREARIRRVRRLRRQSRKNAKKLARIETLIRQLRRSTDAGERASAATMLGHLTPWQMSTEALADAVFDPDPEVQRAAALALHNHGTNRANFYLRLVTGNILGATEVEGAEELAFEVIDEAMVGDRLRGRAREVIAYLDAHRRPRPPLAEKFKGRSATVAARIMTEIRQDIRSMLESLARNEVNVAAALEYYLSGMPEGRQRERVETRLRNRIEAHLTDMEFMRVKGAPDTWTLPEEATGRSGAISKGEESFAVFKGMLQETFEEGVEEAGHFNELSLAEETRLQNDLQIITSKKTAERSEALYNAVINKMNAGYMVVRMPFIAIEGKLDDYIFDIDSHDPRITDVMREQIEARFHTDRVIFISDAIFDIRKSAVRREAIAHAFVCRTLGHEKAIIEQAKVWPENRVDPSEEETKGDLARYARRRIRSEPDPEQPDAEPVQTVAVSPFSQLTSDSEVKLSTLQEAFGRKDIIRALLAGGHIAQPDLFILIEEDPNVAAREKTPSVSMLVAPFKNPQQARPFNDVVDKILTSGTGKISLPLLYKPTAGVLSRGVCFLLSEKPGEITITVSLGSTAHGHAKLYNYLEKIGLESVETPPGENIARVTLNTETQDVAGILRRLWEAISADSDIGIYDAGSIEAVAQAIRVRNDEAPDPSKLYTYETSQYLEGNLLSGKAELLTDEWFGRIGISDFFSTFGGKELGAHEIFDPLYEQCAPPEVQADPARFRDYCIRFRQYANKTLLTEFQYFASRLKEAGIILDKEVRCRIDLEWLPPRPGEEFPRSFITEAGFGFEQKEMDERVYVASAGVPRGQQPTHLQLAETNYYLARLDNQAVAQLPQNVNRITQNFLAAAFLGVDRGGISRAQAAAEMAQYLLSAGQQTNYPDAASLADSYMSAFESDVGPIMMAKTPATPAGPDRTEIEAAVKEMLDPKGPQVVRVKDIRVWKALQRALGRKDSYAIGYVWDIEDTFKVFIYDALDNGCVTHHELMMHHSMHMRSSLVAGRTGVDTLFTAGAGTEYQYVRRLEAILRDHADQKTYDVFHEMVNALGEQYSSLTADLSQELFAWIGTLREYPDYMGGLRVQPGTEDHEYLKEHMLRTSKLVSAVSKFNKAAEGCPRVKEFLDGYYEHLAKSTPKSSRDEWLASVKPTSPGPPSPERPLLQLTAQADLTLGDLQRALCGKYTILNLLRGDTSTIQLPPFIAAVQRDLGILPRLQDGSLTDRSPSPEFTNPADEMKFDDIIRVFLAGDIDSSIIYKPNAAALGDGVAFMEKDDSGNVTVTMGFRYLDDGTITANYLEKADLEHIETDKESQTASITLNASDPKTPERLRQLWTAISIDLVKGKYDAGVVTTMMRCIRTANGKAYSTKLFLRGNLSTGEAEVLRDGWQGKEGASGVISNTFDRKNARELNADEIFDPLHIDPARKDEFEAYARKAVSDKFRYLCNRLKAAGVEVNEEVQGNFDVVWLAPEKQGDFPIPVLIESSFWFARAIDAAQGWNHPFLKTPLQIAAATPPSREEVGEASHGFSLAQPYPDEFALVGSEKFRAMYQRKYGTLPSGEAERFAKFLDRLNVIVITVHRFLQDNEGELVYPEGCGWISQGTCEFLHENGFDARVVSSVLIGHNVIAINVPPGNFILDYGADQFLKEEDREASAVAPVLFPADEKSNLPAELPVIYTTDTKAIYTPGTDDEIAPKGHEVYNAIVRGFQAYALIDSIGNEVTDLRKKGQRLGVPIDLEIGNFGQYSEEFRDELEAKAAKMGFDIIWGKGSFDLAARIKNYLDEDEARIVRGPIKAKNTRNYKRLEKYGKRVSLTAVNDAQIPNDNEQKLYYVPIMPIIEYAVSGSRQNLPPYVVITDDEKKGIISSVMELDLPHAEPIDVKEELRDMYRMDAVFVKNA